MTPALSPQDFVAKWRHATLKERSAAQSHFNDLCALLGQPTPTEADPAGRWYTFEAGAGKTSGGNGWADVWKMGYFAWEYKGQHADLDKAYRQLLQYRESLLNPPLLIVSDLQRIIIHTNFTNTVKRVFELTLDDLLIPDKLDLLRKAFTDPDKLRPGLTPSQVTEEAARHFARLAQLLRRYGNEPHATAHFLIRLLFCLFAEDVGILPDGLFTKLVTQPHKTAGAVSSQLRQLFAAMASGGSFGADEIPLVDGGLFNDDSTLDLDGDSLHILAEVSGLDWSSVEPSVLGTLFVRSLDPDKRSQLGAHYTSEADILLIVEPVLMAPLRRRWGEVKAEAEAKAEKRDLLAGYSKLEAGTAALRGHRQARRSGHDSAPRSRRSCSACCAASARNWPRCRCSTRRAAAAISSTWRCGCCWTWNGRSSPWRATWATAWRSPWSRPRNCTASRSTPTPTSWRRPPSGSATSSGGATTASASPRSRS